MFFFTMNPYSCFCSNPMHLTWSLSCGCSKNLLSVILCYSLPLITAFDLEPSFLLGLFLLASQMHNDKDLDKRHFNHFSSTEVLQFSISLIEEWETHTPN